MIRKFIRNTIRKFDLYRRRVFVAPGTYIGGDVNIGSHTRINCASHIGNCDIGSHCAIGGRLVVRSTDHYTCYLNMQDNFQRYIGSNVAVAGKSKGRVKIGNGVWIGDSVIVLPGVIIGNGAVVGAGSVVTKSIPAYAIAVGNPAKVIKFRFDEQKIYAIEKLDWWNWSEKKIKSNRHIFEIDLQKLSSEEVLRLHERIN